MKKLLAVLLASALFVPAMAGGIFNNVETVGELQTIGTLTSNVGDGSARDTSVRVLFGLNAELVEDVTARVTFLNTNYWGTDIEQPSVGDYWDRIKVAEAYVALSNIFDVFELKLGRQFYGDESSAIIYAGPTHYKGRIYADNANYAAPLGTVQDSLSYDAAVLTFANDQLNFNIVYAKLAEVNALSGNPGDLDVTLLGFDAKYFINNSLFVQAYLYDIRNGAPTPVYHEGLWGAKAGYTDDGLGLSLEFAKNYGGPKVFQYNNYGWLVKADASLKLALDKADITPRVAYVHSEREMITVGNYAPGIYFGGGLNNVFNGNNTRILNVGADFKFADLNKLTFVFNYLNIQYGTENNPEWFGNEYDLLAKYALNQYVELHAGFGFVSNLKNADYDTAYAAQSGVIVKF